MSKGATNRLSSWYYGFGFFGVIASGLMVINFSRIEPAPHVFATTVIVCCAIVTFGLSIFVFQAGNYLNRKREYKKVIAATYIMALMIFPLSMVPAIYVLKQIRKLEGCFGGIGALDN